MRVHVARSVTSTGLAAAALLVVTAFPASAITPPDPWPTGGFFPTGCTNVVLGVSNPTYTDSTVPTLASVDFSVAGRVSGRTLVVGPSGVSGVSLTGRVTSKCSGSGPTFILGNAGVLYFKVGNATSPTTGTTGVTVLAPGSTVDPFNGRYYGALTPFAPVGSPAGVIAAGVGSRLQPLFWVSAPRYTTFELSMEGALVSSTPSTSLDVSSVAVSGLPPLLVLRKTTLSASTSAARVAPGASLSVSGTLRVAKPGAYTPLRDRVTLQRKVGTGIWRSLATAPRTSVRGAVTFLTTNPLARCSTSTASAGRCPKALYRLVYAGNTSAGFNFTAPVTSAVVSVQSTSAG